MENSVQFQQKSVQLQKKTIQFLQKPQISDTNIKYYVKIVLDIRFLFTITPIVKLEPTLDL